EFDHLLLALGSETNFFDLPGVSEWAVTMKRLIDALLLRNRMLALLEEASLCTDLAARRRVLTFVIAGGGFSGVETTGGVNDFVRDAVRYYPQLTEDMIRVVIVHAGDALLPELGEKLGHYAEYKLCERKVEVFKRMRVTGYDGSLVTLANGTSIPAATLIWTAGIKASPAIAALPCRTVGGRLVVDEFLAVPEHPGLWAVGDCAAVPIAKTGKSQPPTAQHGLREAEVAARNIEAAILGRPLKPFIFTTLGQLASIGRRTGVAMVFGIKFSGWFAWMLWRTVYLFKLPGLSKKLRVMTGWTFDLFFPRDLEQILTLRDIEAISDMAARIRARADAMRKTLPPSTEPHSNSDGLGDHARLLHPSNPPRQP
ncbi:MAG: Pyridine nucleotide-disulfide oxidoreductase, FAD/NAD(P)-binding domain protein, partial [Pedosphaera sp.]|nr:Pyridine nucleotide-disulfide oxidoreductase, FAD/NAD(P)-binding domain protein [Pedosphaera sp.]